MPLIILALGIAGLAAGVYLIVVTSRRYGFQEAGRNIASKPGAMLTGGILLAIAGFVAGLLASFILLAAFHNRQLMAQELTKMFGRPPDRLEVQGAGFSHLQGVAYYDQKGYRVESHWVAEFQKDGKKWDRFEITATPLDAEPRGARDEPSGPRLP